MKKIVYLAVASALCFSSLSYASEVKTNDFPSYFKQYGEIKLKDKMLSFFQSTPNGVVSYTLEDAGKASGHICPAVSGAFLMTKAGTNAIATYYAKDHSDRVTSLDPETGIVYRGGVKITMSGKDDSGSAANAIGDVMSYITGAKGADGFKHGPDFPFANRQNLLHYDENLVFNPKTGIEAIFTGMTATYEKNVGDKEKPKWESATLKECAGTWGKCREITKCDVSFKVSYKFKSPDIIGKDPKAPWATKVKNILDNADKAIKVEKVDNPKVLCSQ